MAGVLFVACLTCSDRCFRGIRGGRFAIRTSVNSRRFRGVSRVLFRTVRGIPCAFVEVLVLFTSLFEHCVHRMLDGAVEGCVRLVVMAHARTGQRRCLVVLYKESMPRSTAALRPPMIWL